jgi:ABC-type lipoprotein export system ATPase subunit
MLACLDRPDVGRVEVDGVEVGRLGRRARRRVRRRSIGYVFQQPVDNLLADLDADEHVAFAARLRGVPDPGPAPLEMVGLDHRRHHRPAQLSGGEQQRLAVAVAMVGEPALVVADEPTAELDRPTAAALVDDLLALRDRGVTFVLSSHDPTIVQVADVVVRLRFGRRDDW